MQLKWQKKDAAHYDIVSSFFDKLILSSNLISTYPGYFDVISFWEIHAKSLKGKKSSNY